jgi:hypothetical protein
MECMVSVQIIIVFTYSKPMVAYQGVDNCYMCQGNKYFIPFYKYMFYDNILLVCHELLDTYQVEKEVYIGKRLIATGNINSFISSLLEIYEMRIDCLYM